MKTLSSPGILAALTAVVVGGVSIAAMENVSDELVANQRAALAAATDGAGYGPQSPRDLDSAIGSNTRVFEMAPPSAQMNLCNLHFHVSTEHKGGEFTTYAGNGNGEGQGTGYKYNGDLTEAELAPVDMAIGEAEGRVQSGDTIEVHYVYSTAQVTPGVTLGACLNDAITNPQLRVETQVYVLVNDRDALDFEMLNAHELVDGYHQAINLPTDTGKPIVYAGSTTGPGYNEKGSPFQVTWSVRPNVAKVDILTVDKWFKNNVFEENHAHGVRNLVTNPNLLSPIGG